MCRRDENAGQNLMSSEAVDRKTLVDMALLLLVQDGGCLGVETILTLQSLLDRNYCLTADHRVFPHVFLIRLSTGGAMCSPGGAAAPPAQQILAQKLLPFGLFPSKISVFGLFAPPAVAQHGCAAHLPPQ